MMQCCFFLNPAPSRSTGRRKSWFHLRSDRFVTYLKRLLEGIDRLKVFQIRHQPRLNSMVPRYSWNPTFSTLAYHLKNGHEERRMSYLFFDLNAPLVVARKRTMRIASSASWFGERFFKAFLLALGANSTTFVCDK